MIWGCFFGGSGNLFGGCLGIFGKYFGRFFKGKHKEKQEQHFTKQIQSICSKPLKAMKSPAFCGRLFAELQGGFVDVLKMFSRQFSVNFPHEISRTNPPDSL